MKNINLLKIREKINIIDMKIIKYIYERRKLSKKIIKIKKKNNLFLRDQKREIEVIKNISKKSKKYKLNNNFIKQIFKKIIKDSIILQQKYLNKNICKYDKKDKFSFLGPLGSYSYLAICKYINLYNKKKNMKLKSCKNFLEVIKNTEEDKSSYSIIPIENSNSGFIHESINLLKNSTLKVISEIEIKIKHCLLTAKNTDYLLIKKIYSHYQPIKQCKSFLSNFPHWKIKKSKSTSEAMKKVLKKQSNHCAVIGNKEGSIIYNLKILNKNLLYNKNNITRFLILSKKNNDKYIKGNFKTILIFSILKKTNSFVKLLILINNLKLEINALKKYVYKKKVSYILCYLEILEHEKTKNMQYMLYILKKKSIFLKKIGCYITNKNKN
ncbi:prephenate dehydratase domain-containing protein [Buchnera aphidicola (Taiwanaphis decaspermi)]|uniref:prephenate dehydratase domain-containing protein n=1 Tax=Buchnera aphidicola TaxID=9 RepID=UPI0031B84B53